MEFEDWQFDPDILGQAESASELDLPVLLIGETGTGHEGLARIIHGRSARCSAPFVDINGAAIPERLFAELLGSETRLPTGKTQQSVIDLASGGTIFIFPLFPVRPSICDILLPLLPAAHEKRAMEASRARLMVAQIAGEPEPPAWDQRHRLLERCSWYEVRLPSLRERPGAIPELARRHLTLICTAGGLGTIEMDASACEFLQEQTWPGNLRQLANVVDRAALLSTGRVLTAEEFRHTMSML